MSSRPEQTFFEDPALDRILGVVMSLATELYVARDKVRVLEALLVEKELLEPGEVERFEPGPGVSQLWEADRDAFVAAILDGLSGEPASKSIR